jgi:two-component system, OmpR family, KDP operon response regulator KdpE
MTVLIVDDDPDQLNLRGMVLSQNGFETLQALDKASAKTLAALHRPEAAVVDLRLPTERDGFELLRALKLGDSGIRLLVLTGASAEAVRHTPEANLIDDVLTKPASVRELIEHLRRYQRNG